MSNFFENDKTIAKADRFSNQNPPVIRAEEYDGKCVYCLQPHNNEDTEDRVCAGCKQDLAEIRGEKCLA